MEMCYDKFDLKRGVMMIKIGEGISATVYSDGKYAYKKYRPNYSVDNMRFEVYIQNEIYEHTDLRVAKYEIIDDMIRMTLFEGLNLADRIMKENDIQGLQDFIDLQLETFKYKDLNLADAFETFVTQIKETKLDDALKEKALASIDKIEKKYHLCHFDYHPENIMYHDNEPYIIDWTNAKLGNPVMDIASTYIIFRVFAEAYADLYLNTMIEKGFDKSKIVDAIPVMAFIRLRENEDPNHDFLLKAFVMGTDNIFHQT